MNTLPIFSFNANRRSRACFRVSAIALMLSLCGLSMHGEAHAVLNMDKVDVSVMGDEIATPEKAVFDEVLTISEFAMIMTEAGLDPSLVGYSEPQACFLCLLSHPNNPEFCNPWCK